MNLLEMNLLIMGLEMTDFSLAEWIGEHSTRYWIFYDDEEIMAWLEDGRLYWEAINERNKV